MEVLGGLIALIALGLLLLGLVVIVRPISQLGFSERWYGLLVFVGGVVLVMAAREVSPTVELSPGSAVCYTNPATGSPECIPSR